MAFPASFTELRTEIWPRWAQRPRWAAFLGVLHQQMDDVVSRMKWSIGARLVEKAPDDALASIGGNCNLPKPRAMTAAAYRAHLRRPFERWYDSSTPAGLAREVAALGYPRVEIYDWRTLADAGAALLVLECVPRALAVEITRTVSIPVIGIGAGAATDAQVLVMHDMLGMNPRAPRFVQNFMTDGRDIAGAFAAYAAAVRDGSFPRPEHGFD